MAPVNERDVARLLEGRISDPHEARRIMDEIEKNPALARLAEFLSDPDDDEDVVPGLSPKAFPDLSRTQLCRILPGEGLPDLNAGGSGRSTVEFARGSQLHTFELGWTTEGDVVRFTADWPSGLRPVGLVLAQFDLVKGRTPFHQEIKLPPLPKPNSTGASSVKSSLIPTISGAKTGEPRTAAAATGGEARTEKSPEKTPDFWGERVGSDLMIRGKVGDGFEEETVAVAVSWTGSDQTPQSVRMPVTLKQVPWDSGKATIKSFPWPVDRLGDRANLTVEPMKEGDLVYLSNEQVTGLMATEYEHFVALPLEAQDEGCLSADFHYPSEKAVAAESKTTWWLSMAVEGGAA